MRERDRQTERLREAAIVCACTLGAMNFSWIVFHCLSVSFSGASLECFGGYLILFKSRFMNHAWSTPAPWYAEFPILQCSIFLGGYPKALNSKMLALCRRHSVRMKLGWRGRGPKDVVWGAGCPDWGVARDGTYWDLGGDFGCGSSRSAKRYGLVGKSEFPTGWAPLSFKFVYKPLWHPH